MTEINKELVQELLGILKSMGYDCQLIGGAAYTLYTNDTNTIIKDLDIRFPLALTTANVDQFAAEGIVLTQFLDINSIGSYRDNIARKSTLNAEFKDRIKYLTKARFKGIDVDLLVFHEDTLQGVLSTFDISFNCIAYDGVEFIKGNFFTRTLGVWLKPLTAPRYKHMCDKFKHKHLAVYPFIIGTL